jgi:hypothetical protein
MAFCNVALAWSNAPWYSGERLVVDVVDVAVVMGVVSVSSTVAAREVFVANPPLWLLLTPLLALVTVLRRKDEDDAAGAQAWACCVAQSTTKRAVVEIRIIMIEVRRDLTVAQASR